MVAKNLMPDLKLVQLAVAHLEPVSLSVNDSELICISGESGSGKSLLLRAIADIIPHQGDVLLSGESASSMTAPEWRRKVALLPAESQWWDEEVSVHFESFDQQMLNEMGLPDDAFQWQVSRCSTGEKQRLALLRMLALKPACLLLDEPTGSLDPQNTRRVENLIQVYRTQHPVPVIWVSHSEHQIQRIADRHYMMVDGKLNEVRD